MKPPPAQPARPVPPDAAFEWARGAGLGHELAREVRAQARRRTRQRWTMAVGACGVLLLSFGWWTSTPAPVAVSKGRGPGWTKVLTPEKRRLADGSVVELKGDAAIAVELSETMRRVVLSQGEAHFEVAKDPARPFVVAAQGVEVRAVGTAFSVALGQKAVDVLVTAGRVAVERAPSPAPASTTTVRDVSGGGEWRSSELAAGNRTSVGVAGAGPVPEVVAVPPDEMARRLAWRVPRLEFEAAPLGEVARMFSEHGRVQLELAEPDLDGVKVSGFLRADNTDALLQLLAADHGIEGVRRGTGIVLRRRR